MPRTRALVAALAAVGALTLVACTPGAFDGDEDPSASSTPSQAPPPSDAPADPNPSDFEPAPSEPPVVAPVDGALELACADVLTAEQVYEFNPEMLATDAPAGGLPDAFTSVVDAGGVVCAWQHATSGDVLLVGVQASDAGVEGAGTAGDLTTWGARSGDRFVLVGSKYFEGAEDQAQQLAAEVVGNIG